MEIATAPEVPGVFELATMVRTVMLIGAAPENLQAELMHHLRMPGHHLLHGKRLYFRFRPTDQPDAAQADLLTGYRTSHGGALPAAQDAPVASPEPRRHLKAV